MRTEDLKLISEVGQALYATPEVAATRSVETVAALTSVERLSEDQTFERALLALLARAEKDGLQAHATGIAQPFYRLTPTERFVLVILHSGKISYARLSRILGMTPIELQALAWHARTRLASQPEVRVSAPHPSGGERSKANCPDYEMDRPWTQKFLDDEMSGQELLMIQNHTVVCESCRRALSAARVFYYAVEGQIPTSSLQPEQMESALRAARLKLGERLPADLSFKEAMRIFLARKEIRVYLFLFTAILIYALSR